MNYICINEFQVNKYDDNGFALDNEYLTVKESSIWIENDNNHSFIGGEIRLENEKTLEWLEISKERLDKYFKKV